MTANAIGSNWEAVRQTMLTQRAVREFSDAPVDDALIERAIRAATFAPSGGNTQPWRFIVIRDRDTKAKLGLIFDELGRQIYG
ncbi:MAG TPA: nitroreductase family protein, partial [Dehalococcoidia bacterium]|nr:nitroreductase family protein [Dehalococcoidia bacterium]